MVELGRIFTEKAVVHSISKFEEIPKYSAFPLDLEDDEETVSLIEGYVEKLFKSKKKSLSEFNEDEVKAKILELSDDVSKFMEITKFLSERMHKFLYRFPDSQDSFEAAFILFEMENEIFLGCFKMNHKEVLVTKTHQVNSGEITSLEKTKRFVSKPRAAIDEGFIVHLDRQEVFLLDKSYSVEGEKVPFFSEGAFKMNVTLSEFEKLKNFENLNKRIVSKFIGNDVSARATINESVIQCISEEGRLDVKEFSEKLFPEDKTFQELYKDALKKSLLMNEKIDIPENVENKYRIQKIATDSGIKMDIPVDYIKDSSRFEIIHNADGTVNFVIKNIEDYS